ncbi:hypothetical protein BD311DRAFT_865912 [Dichomitus squalens]|uniref:DUF6534 domain-containing protein n=1 Tax=Dichomitus squalens TaxID=114155 RepID=A0A4Q9MLX7_9APHY|nr:hypothetical protein BD311DRAFT_865912 [Dichomitus squalens]
MSQTSTVEASAEASLILSKINRGGTIGVINIGVAMSAMVYGVTCIQTFQYYRSAKSKEDSLFIKALVPSLWFLDSVHQALVMHVSYFYLITNYANPAALLQAVWSIPSTIIVTGVIAFLADGFFLLRIWRLKRNMVITANCILATVAHLATNLPYPIRFLEFRSLVEAEAQLKATGTASLAVGAAANVVISGAMVWILSQEKATTRRGLLTCIFEIAALVSYLAAPSLLYNLFFEIILGKLYVNAVLTALNSRAYVGKKWGGGVDISSISLPTFQLDGTSFSNNRTTDSAAITIDETNKEGDKASATV